MGKLEILTTSCKVIFFFFKQQVYSDSCTFDVIKKKEKKRKKVSHIEARASMDRIFKKCCSSKKERQREREREKERVKCRGMDRTQVNE